MAFKDHSLRVFPIQKTLTHVHASSDYLCFLPGLGFKKFFSFAVLKESHFLPLSCLCLLTCSLNDLHRPTRERGALLRMSETHL
jgi:hypothetical protein